MNGAVTAGACEGGRVLPPGVQEGAVRIPSPRGSLEGVLSYRPEAPARSAVLLLSPHPRFGGDFENNVLAIGARRFAAEGRAALRFNYPGVGKSEGPFRNPMESFRYWSEVLEGDAYDAILADCGAALSWLGDIAAPVHFFGYSFGAVLALRLALERPEVLSVAAVALATGEFRFDFLAMLETPVLAIHPRNDFATPPATVAATLAAESSPAKSPRELVVLDGTDHFFRRREEEVARVAEGFFHMQEERAALDAHAPRI